MVVVPTFFAESEPFAPVSHFYNQPRSVQIRFQRERYLNASRFGMLTHVRQRLLGHPIGSSFEYRIKARNQGSLDQFSLFPTGALLLFEQELFQGPDQSQ